MPSETVTFREGTTYTIIATDVPTNERYTWRILGGNATYGTDYSLNLGPSGSVVNPQPGFRFSVTFNTDSVVDPGEFFDLEVTEVEDGVTTVFNYHVIIEDTTVPAAGALTFSPTSIQVPEGAQIPFSLVWNGFTQPSLYSISSVNGTAVAGSDFTVFNTTGTASGQGFAYFTISTLDDKLEEPTETFTVTATPGRGSGATLQVTITDNDTLRCLLDLDHDGVGSVQEIGMSMIVAQQANYSALLKSIGQDQDRIAGKLDALIAERTETQEAAYRELAGALLGALTLGTSNQLIAWMSALTPGVQAIAEALGTGKIFSDDNIVNAMFALIGSIAEQQKLPAAGVPTVLALGQAIASVSNLEDLKLKLSLATAEIRALRMQQNQIEAKAEQVQADLAALNACLIRSGAIRAEDVDVPGARTILAEHDGVGGVALNLEGSASASGFRLPAGMAISAGTSGADRLVGVGAQFYSAAAGAGDDVIRVGGGAAYVDGDSGVDSVVVLDAGGRALALNSISTATVVPAAGAPLASITLKNGSYLGAKDVEYFIFSDGYGTVTNGQWRTTAFDSRVSSAGLNVLRDASGADPLKLVQVAQAGNTPAAISTYVDSLVRSAAATTSVATLSYEFFTGKIPSAAGLDYLVSPTGPNPNNLNSAYFQSFSLENRYINFAVNLGKFGEGAASFQQRYGNLSLFEATRQAYTTIFGSAPSDAKLHAILDPVFQLGSLTLSRTDYFAIYGGDGANGIGTKAAMVGYLLAEAVKADVGVYAKVNDAFLADVADGANYAVDIVGVYNRPEYVFGG